MHVLGVVGYCAWYVGGQALLMGFWFGYAYLTGQWKPR